MNDKPKDHILSDDIDAMFWATQDAAAIAFAGPESLPRQESNMEQKPLSWFDRLLIKIAVTKAAARGGRPVDMAGLARSLAEAFAVTREASRDTSRSGDREGTK